MVYKKIDRYTLNKQKIIDDYSSITEYIYKRRLCGSHVYFVISGGKKILGKQSNFDKYGYEYMIKIEENNEKV